MKKIVWTYFFVLIVHLTQAQSWSTVKNNGINFYLAEDYKHTLHRLNLLKSDTLSPDLIRFEFNKTPTVNPYRDECFVKEKATWIGYQVLRETTGVEKYLNYASDTLVFHTHANLNDTWQLFRYADSSYITATIDSVTTLSFMGISDSVKYIRLNRYQQDGSKATDLMNGVRVIISKNYGWIRTLAWINFPEVKRIYASSTPIEKYNFSQTFFLSGNSQINKGLLPNFNEFISDFEVGDEIHSRYSTSPPYTFTEIKTILTKSKADSFTVYTSRILRKYLKWKNQTQSDSFAYSIQTDTIRHSYGEMWPQTVRFSYLPGTKRINLDGMANMYEWSNKDSCYATTSASSVNVHRKNSIQGIGNFYGFSSYTLQSYTFEPVYYKKGNEVWGTPLAFDSADYYNPAEFRLITAGHQKAVYRQGVPQDSSALLLPFIAVHTQTDSLKTTFHFPFYASENGNGCVSLKHASWLGKKVESHKNGDVIFYNYKDEPILIKSQAQPKEKWVAYRYPNGHYISAEVDTLIIIPHPYPFKGFNASDYKTIVFRKYANDTTEIEHHIHNITITLTRQNGWSALTEFNYFPFEGQHSHKTVIWQKYPISMFNIDDRISGTNAATLLHRKNFDLPSQTTENSLIRTPQTSNLGDTLIKKLIHCKRIDDLSGNKISFSQHEQYDTIPVVEYSYLSMQPIHNNTLVKEFYITRFYTNDTIRTTPSSVRVRNIRYSQTAPDCWTEIKEDTTNYEYYWPQLGMYKQVILNNTGKCIKREWPQFGMLPDVDFGKQLVFQCQQLDTFNFTSPLSSDADISTQRLVVYPNPSSSGNVTVLWNSEACCEDAQVTLTDMVGRNVWMKNIKPNEPFNMHIEKTGVYFITIHQREKLIYSGKLIRM